jgi:hypothetical protein
MRVAARGDDPFRAGFDDLHGVASREIGRGFSDVNTHQLARKAVAHEDHPAVCKATNSPAGGGAFDTNWGLVQGNRLTTHLCSLLKSAKKPLRQRNLPHR